MYDPLYHAAPGPQAAPAPSYWHTHTQPLWPSTSAGLPATAEVVVIGGGYTGLNAALELAERYQQEVVVVEANDLGWGCSTRNAGFAMPGTGRLGYSHWQTKYGEAAAQAIQHEYQAAFAQLERHQQACPEQLQAQFGGRGAVRGKDAEHSRYADRLLRALVTTFPTLQDLLLEPPAYFWSGWVAAAFDNYPRVYQTPLPRFPLPRLRRIAQRLYYGWYGLRDQIPLSR